jgi:8-amino-7-oxononanoate synthase
MTTALSQVQSESPKPTPDLLDKFSYYRDEVQRLQSLPHMPFRTQIDKAISPCESLIGGRRVIMVGSNNYLGLTFDPALIEASQTAAAEYGVGTTGSRMANGTFGPHSALERELAQFLNKRHCMVFTTGHQTNLSVIGALGGPQDVILIDADSHASIYDACRMSSAQILRFRHNDPEDLEKKLARLDGASKNKLIVVEGCYSMFGDVAPLPEIVELKKRHNAYLLVDEAHSFGVFGDNGRGAGEHFGVESDIDFATGTFSKALAGVGGFCVSDHDVLPLLHFCARAYMFTASGTPSSVESVRAALVQLQARPELRAQLWRAANFMRDGFHRLGFNVASGDSPIVSLIIGEAQPTVAFWEGLLDAGLYCNLFLPPATPKKGCLVRTSYTAAHRTSVLEEALHIFETVGRSQGLIP